MNIGSVPRPAIDGGPDPTGGRVRAALILAFQPLLLNAISLFATAYIVRRLGPYDYGVWAVAMSLTTANAFLTNLGVRPLFVRALAQDPAEAAVVFGDQLVVRGIMSVGASTLAIAACLALGYPRAVLECVGIGTLSLLLSVLWTVYADVLQARHRFSVLAAASLLAGSVVTVATVIAAWGGGGPVVLATAYVTGPAATLVFLRAAVRRERITAEFAWAPERYHEMFREARSIGAQQFLSMLRDRFEELVVPRLAGIESFGLFAAGILPASRLAQIADGIATAFYPAIARTSGDQDNRGDATAHVGTMITIALATTLPLATILAFVAPTLMSILFPAGAGAAVRVMIITAWSVPLAALSTTLNYALQAGGRHRLAAVASIRATLISTAISMVAIWKFGVVGASWGLVVRPALLTAFLVRPMINAWPAMFGRMPLWRIGLSAGVAAVVLRMSSATAPMPLVAFWAAVSAFTYVSALLALQVITVDTIVAVALGRPLLTADSAA